MRKFLVGTLLTIASLSSGAQAVATVSQSMQSETADRITVTFENTPVQEALWTISKRSGARIVFAAKMLPDRKVSYQGVNVATATALTAVLQGTGATYERMENGAYKVVRGQTAKGQGVIVGKVTDAKTGKGISGASISADNDTRGVTGEEGSYRLAGLAAGAHTVSVRLLGYVKQTRSVTVGEAARVTADFKLEASANVLDQVIVTGTVVQTELRAVPNAITVITAKQIEERGITRIEQLFRGDVPGLFAQNRGSLGDDANAVTMFSRGATAFPGGASAGTNDGTNPIKTYVDGIELADSKYISQIDPKSIERIEILTGPQASTIYGSNAINGVVQIFTKKGTTSKPQLTVGLLGGWVENNFSNALTPQHDYSTQLSGVEGRVSYNVGGSWVYTGAWTPSRRLARTATFGGIQLETPIKQRPVSLNLTLRRTASVNRQGGSARQGAVALSQIGFWPLLSTLGASSPFTTTLTGQTFGLTVVYKATEWWSHELGLGKDISEQVSLRKAPLHQSSSDTLLSFSQPYTGRRSLRYTTVARLPVNSLFQGTVTLGADEWQNLVTSLTVSPATLTGTLTGTPTITRQSGHNTGGFFQAQLGMKDQLFLTYGLRLEWNPTFGEDAQPNYAPRYGVSYARDIGYLTTKFRASYGRSTRPPQPDLKVARTATQSGIASILPEYGGEFDIRLANPELGPEHQAGGEGGIELYWGGRGSLVVTRYNQTINELIDIPSRVDSVRSVVVNPTFFGRKDSDGYGIVYQSKYMNVGSIRNQGWELQGSVNTGPFTTRGTYSWSKSRVIGIPLKYRSVFPASSGAQYQPGATFQYLPEHTWAVGFNYAHSNTVLAVNLNGTGQIRVLENDFLNYAFARLVQNRPFINTSGYVSFNNGYAMADFNATHRFSPRIETVLQIQNLTNRYTNDYSGQYAVIGRQTKLGIRCHL